VKRQGAFLIAWAIVLAVVAFLLFSGCAVEPGQTRKITAYGIWSVVAGNPIGLGYWHSEIGDSDKIKSEESDQPGL
jgi:hypothetical protein